MSTDNLDRDAEVAFRQGSDVEPEEWESEAADDTGPEQKEKRSFEDEYKDFVEELEKYGKEKVGYSLNMADKKSTRPMLAPNTQKALVARLMKKTTVV